MIDVRVADYCYDCEMFNADTVTTHSMSTYEPIHHVVCSYRDECRHIKNHLEKKLTEEKKDG